LRNYLQRPDGTSTHGFVGVNPDAPLDESFDVLITSHSFLTMHYKEKINVINCDSFQVSTIIAHLSGSLLEL
jgi:hypothetical protein